MVKKEKKTTQPLAEKIEYRNQWQRENLDRIAFTVPKGQRAKIKALAMKKGFSSTNAYLQSLISKDLEE